MKKLGLLLLGLACLGLKMSNGNSVVNPNPAPAAAQSAVVGSD